MPKNFFVFSLFCGLNWILGYWNSPLVPVSCMIPKLVNVFYKQRVRSYVIVKFQNTQMSWPV